MDGSREFCAVQLAACIDKHSDDDPAKGKVRDFVRETQRCRACVKREAVQHKKSSIITDHSAVLLTV
jgi:hypothetical protein